MDTKKLKIAGKRITAVAASAALVSSAAFAGSLADYPNNFVKDGKFMGKVVVGAAADAMDTTSAQLIIDDLKAELSGDVKKVKITYKSASNSGGSVDVIKSNSQLNYGETLGSSNVTEKLDDNDVSFLADGRFNNGKSDEDYTQEITLKNGVFNHALRDNVDGVDKISDNIYYSNGQEYLEYVLTFDNPIPVSTTNSENEADFVGETLTIMGNEFTIAALSQSSGNITKLELIGGANKISLGEGEVSSVTINGNTYEVAVQNVDTSGSSNKVLLTVNGVSKTVSEFDTEDFGGVSVAVTDLVGSSRDSVKGYAEIVVGGQKITLEDNQEVQVNEEDVSDIYPGYRVESTIDTGGFSTITIKYMVDDDTILEAGDSLVDPLFGGFSLVFEGTNNPEYSTLEVRSSSDDVQIDGKLISGDSFNRAFVHTNTTNGTDGITYVVGDQDSDRYFFYGSVKLGTAVDTDASNSSVVFDFNSTSIKGNGFFLYDDAEDQYLYEVSSVDTVDKEVDLDEILQGKDKTTLKPSEVTTDLEKTIIASVNDTTGILNINLSSLGTPELGFENELLMNFGNVESASGVTGSYLTFKLDTQDVDGDDATTDEDEEYNVTLAWDSIDDEFDLKLDKTDNDFVNKGDADVEDGNSDVQEYVTSYGTKVVYDNDENTYVKIMVPKEQVYAKVNLVTGDSSSSVMTVTVSEDELETKKQELKDEGYTIVNTESVSSEDVEFDISAPVTDDVASADDAIVVGGPAVNKAAAELLGLSYPTYGEASGVMPGQAVIRYFGDRNAVLVYGWSKEDTKAAAEKLAAGTGLSGDMVNVQ
jgi:hypothetical protein